MAEASILQAEPREPAAIRVLRIYSPPEGLGIVYLAAFTVVAFVVVVGAIIMTAAFFAFLRPNIGVVGTASVLAVGILGGSASLLYGCWHFLRRQRLEDTPRWRQRHTRLEQLTRRADAITRVPHRVLEYTLSRGQPLLGWTRSRLRRIPARTLILVMRCGAHPRLRVQPAQEFEPLDLRRDPAGLFGLAEPSMAGREWQREFGPVPSISNPLTQFIAISASGVFTLALMHGRGFVRDLASGRLSPFQPIVFAVAIMLIPALRAVLQIGGPVWLVPGGLVTVGRSLFRRSRKFARVGPNDTPLVLTLATDSAEPRSRAYFLSRGRACSVRTHAVMLIGVAAGWLSTAARPSDAQVEAFVNPW